MLGRLATLARSSDLHRIKYSLLKFRNNKMVYSSKPRKNHTKEALVGLFLDELAQDPALCPVKAWQAYIERTKLVSQTGDGVFVSARAPYKEVSVDTLANDTLAVMSAAGIDISHFKAHSTRTVAASKALDAGATVM